MAQPYTDPWSYWQDELRLAYRLLLRHALRLRSRLMLGANVLGGLGALSETDLVAYFDSLARDHLQANGLDGSIAQLRLAIDERTAAAGDGGPVLPLDLLCRRFQLDGPARRLLQLLCACQAEPAARELLGALTGTRWRPFPTAGGLADLLAAGARDRSQLLGALRPAGPLRRQRLLAHGPRPEGWPEREPVPVELQSVVLPQRVIDFIAGHDAIDREARSAAVTDREARSAAVIDPELEGIAQRHSASAGLSELPLEEITLRAIDRAWPQEKRDRPPRAWLRGPLHSGLHELAAALSGASGRTSLILRGDRLVRRDCAIDLAAVVREAALGHDAIVLDLTRLTSDLAHESDTAERLWELAETLDQAARRFDLPLLVLTVEAFSGIQLHLPDLEPVPCVFPSPERRAQMWPAELAAAGLSEPADLSQIAEAYAFGRADIRRVCQQVRRRRELAADDAPLGLLELEDACRADLELRLPGVARRVHGTYTAGDLVLTAEQEDRLMEVIDYVSLHKTLMQTWGFGQKFITGRGTHCLFTGPPGTGKTMTATVLATTLQLPLYRIELSQIVDRYVGETEKKLAQLFDEAGRFPCALLFDEADSLFAKRTEVRSSNDRYANLEVNYLLQRMEDFEGITILTTNLDSTIDPAFRRRIRFSIRFPEPDDETRLRLWSSLIPPEAALAEDVDFQSLAEAFSISGGHIRNAILRAAVRALRDDRPISHEDLHWASRIEYENLGRLEPSA